LYKACYAIFFSISYFLSIDVTLFKIILLPILSFLLVYTHFLIFSAKQLPFAVVVGYVVLFVLQGFSLVSLIQKQEAIWESSDITLLASAIFRSQLFWLIITAFGVTFTTIKKIAASKPLSIQLTFASIYFVVLSQIILVTHVFSPADFLYWQKMITVVILWDFIYMPFSVTINDIKDDHFRSRLLVLFSLSQFTTGSGILYFFYYLKLCRSDFYLGMLMVSGQLSKKVFGSL
jgi:hypothetical protein